MRRGLAGAALLGVLAWTAAAAGPGTGVAGSGPDRGLGLRAGTAGRGGERYWTAERMRRADQAANGTSAVADAAVTRDTTSNRARRPRSTLPPPISEAVRWTSPGEVSRAVGRVFFTLRDRDYSCTGTVVAARNRDTVLTAGHCVDAGPGPFATNWVFVPGYRDGQRPYGVWTARRLLAPADWVASGTTRDDIGFAVVNGFSTVRLPSASMKTVFTTPESRYDLQSAHAFDMRSRSCLAVNASCLGSSETADGAPDPSRRRQAPHMETEYVRRMKILPL